MNDVISDDVTIVHILMNTHVKFFRLSLDLCKNEILVSKMVVYFQLKNGRHFDFLNVAIVTSTYARHSLNARNELLAGAVFFKENIIVNTE